MIVDWTDEFDRWLTNAEEQGGKLLEVAVALLQALNDLPAKPEEESPTFKRVRQARRHELWRVALALVGFDKKAIGDVFYASAAARGEAVVDDWLRQKGSSHD